MLKSAGQVALRLVEGPCGTEESDLLVRVRIADHDLLDVAAGLQRPPIDREAKERGHGPTARRGVPALARRAGRSTAGRLMPPGSARPRLLHEEEDSQHVGRSFGSGDDIGLDGSLVPAVERFGDDAERADDVPGLF